LAKLRKVRDQIGYGLRFIYPCAIRKLAPAGSPEMALLEAAGRGDRQTAERLLSEGVDPDVQNARGENPTAPRRQGKSFRDGACLLSAGADHRVREVRGAVSSKPEVHHPGIAARRATTISPIAATCSRQAFGGSEIWPHTWMSWIGKGLSRFLAW